MDEALITLVVPAKDDTGNGVELEIRMVGGDILEFRLAHKLVFTGDWDGNFLQIFERALKIWK